VAAVAVGNGFTLPPSQLAELPILAGRSGRDQAALVETVNAGLAATGTAPLRALAEVFAADRVVAEVFAELDPYSSDRREPTARPIPPDFAATAGNGEEIFVYAPETLAAGSALWRGLAECRRPVRVHVPRAGAELVATLARLGLAFEPAPLPFDRIAARSRLLVSHGGPGFVSSGMAAGVPHVVFHYDLEKLCCGVAVARAGLGGHIALASLEPRAFAASLDRLYRDEALAARARAAAPGFRSRGQPPPEQAVTEAVAALA
jgi:hypothetical protein